LSLSVEEHFYLLLPGTLVLLPQRWRLAALGVMVALVDGWRLYRLQTRPLLFLMHHTDTRLDALLVPAMIAIILSHPRGRALLLKICRFWFIPAAVLLYMLTSSGHPAWALFFQSLLIPIMILGTVLYPQGYFAQLLEFAPIRWLGKISYSLYLWQGMFFLERFFPGYRPLGWMQTFPWRAILLLACAITSYYLVEKPMIKWGHKLAPAATPGRPEIPDTASRHRPTSSPRSPGRR
jgi:peptidoglycan/LPS O-acetylase OafA/YrhL